MTPWVRDGTTKKRYKIYQCQEPTYQEFLSGRWRERVPNNHPLWLVGKQIERLDGIRHQRSKYLNGQIDHTYVPRWSERNTPRVRQEVYNDQVLNCETLHEMFKGKIGLPYCVLEVRRLHIKKRLKNELLATWEKRHFKFAPSVNQLEAIQEMINLVNRVADYNEQDPKVFGLFEDTCVVCYDEPAVVLTSGCSHICTCADCARRITLRAGLYKCPMCRAVAPMFGQVIRPVSKCDTESSTTEVIKTIGTIK